MNYDDIIFKKIVNDLYVCIGFRYGGYPANRVFDDKDIEAYSRIYKVEIKP